MNFLKNPLFSAIALVLLLAGTVGPMNSLAQDGTPAAAAVRTEYPLTVENCGFTTTYEEAPSRVISIYSPATEMLVALGLEDQIIGTAWNDTEPMESQRAIIEALPVIADETPSREVLTAATPDFVYITYDGGFTEEGVGTREELAGFGTATYQSQAYCGDGGHSIESVYSDIRTLGQIFDVQDRAEELVDSIAGDISEVQETVSGLTEGKRVFLFDTSGDPESAPYTAACCGTADQSIQLAGGVNIFTEIPGTYFNYAQVSWEEVAARDPEVIVIALFAGADAEEFKDYFRNNPGLAEITAVREDQFVVVPYSEIIPGIRAGSFVRLMAEGMYPELFADTATPETE